MKNIVSFSGGKDSTAMLLMMIERKIPIDYIIYVDTTKDFPAMYSHIDKVAEFIKPYEITRLSFNFDYWLGKHIKTKGKNKGKIGYGWPDFRNRWCTRLKVWTISKFLKDIDAIEYHGIAFDERHRTKNNKGRNIKYPLIDWEVTEAQALAYCYNRGFNWEGLYNKFSRLSCYCCPLSRIGELRTVYNDFPEQWMDMKELDKKSFRQFSKDFSLDSLEKRFAKEKLIENMDKQ